MFQELLYSAPALMMAGLAQCWLLTSIAIHLAPRLGIVDQPDYRRKVHRKPTPLMGGVAIFLAFTLCAIEGWCMGLPWLVQDHTVTHIHLMLFVSGGLFCALGLYDDRYHLRPLHKFLGQIVAALPFAIWGHHIDVVNVLGWTIDLGWLGIPLTVFWLVACTNLINLMDGLDGLAAGLSLVVSVTVAILGVMTDVPGVAGLNLILAAVLVGFLLHNWTPARIFMGDSGSLTLGFLVGAFAIESSFKTATGLTLVPPIVLLSIPMFDTVMAILRRKLNGRGIGEADRQHFHHCLRDRGLSTSQSVLAILGLCTAMGAAVVISELMEYEALAMGICGAVLSLLILGRVFGFHETSLLFEQISTISRILRVGGNLLRHSVTLTRVRMGLPQHPEGMWELLQQRVQEMHGTELSLSIQDSQRRGDPLQMRWNGESGIDEGTDWELTCQLPREGGQVVQLRAHGRHLSRLEHLPLGRLYDLLQLFCQNWPVEAQQREGTIPFPVPAPHFHVAGVKVAEDSTIPTPPGRDSQRVA